MLTTIEIMQLAALCLSDVQLGIPMPAYAEYAGVSPLHCITESCGFLASPCVSIRSFVLCESWLTVTLALELGVGLAGWVLFFFAAAIGSGNFPGVESLNIFTIWIRL